MIKGLFWCDFQSGQTCKVNGLTSEERKNECSAIPQRDMTPTPPIGPPKQNGAGKNLNLKIKI